MNKSLLNIAVTMALSSAVFSGSVLSTRAFADELMAEELVITANDNSNSDTAETYMYPGMGVGAATGTLIAGPVGFVVGGFIGALVGSSQEVYDEVETKSEINILANNSEQEIGEDNETSPVANTADNEEIKAGNSIQLAQLGPMNSVVEDDINSQQEELMNILVSDLSLDVYFRSGSTDIEKFYPARLAAIADLVNTMDNLELHLDGYTDRRGNKEQNIALANERINKVRDQLINEGVDESRIVSKAFGEARMMSSAGNLDAYTFDRRVVIRFERASDSIGNSMAAAFSMTEDEQITTSVSDDSIDGQAVDVSTPVVADVTTRF